ncbi:HD domain-containing protein [bacterium]|nr:HD domain-containing protein [bacterium]
MDGRILIVDNNLKRLTELEGILKNYGYTVIASSDPMTVRASIIVSSPDIVILGTDFPNFDGFDLCQRINKDPLIPTVAVILTSSERNEIKIARGFDAGAVDFITEPYHAREIEARISAQVKLKNFKSNMEEKNVKLENIVEKQNKTISDMQMAIIFSLAKLAQSRDDDTGKHLERVQKYCLALSSEIAKSQKYKNIVNDEFIKNIVYASPLHDIGKVAIPDAILLKPGKLTPEEFEVMKTHSERGAATLEEVNRHFENNSFIKMGIDIARHHHERWDGKGYPDGLKGEEIPLSARIMAIADVYDALSSKRAYKDAFPHKKCVEIIQEGRGTQFDADLVDAFLNIQDEFSLTKQLYGDISTRMNKG